MMAQDFVRSHKRVMHKNEGGFSSHFFEEDVGHFFFKLRRHRFNGTSKMLSNVLMACILSLQ